MPDLKALFSELIRFETELWNAVDARLRHDCDLPLTQFEPLQIIGRREACRVHDIAEELGVTVGGISKIVDRIEASGRCRRRPNPGDRRSCLIELTPAGRRLLASATEAFEDELQIRLGSAVSERSLQQFGAALAKLRAQPSRTGHWDSRTARCGCSAATTSRPRSRPGRPRS